MSSPRFPRHFLALAAALAASTLHAQQDAPPIDAAQLLQALRGIKDAQVLQTKAQKQRALQDVQTAGASPTAAVAAWEEAVRLVQFEGSNREGAQFKEWRDREGDALREKEAANAAQLHFRWMALTLQRSLGVPLKDMLPLVVNFTKEVAANQVAMDALEEATKREKELAAAGKHVRDRKNNGDMVKRMHDQILRTAVNAGPPAKAMKLGEMLDVDKWELSPGNMDGIFERIVLPELRVMKDARLLEYWDMKLKREAEAAAKSKLAFDADKFNQTRRPELLWNRAQDLIVLGQRNRAVGEMFNIVKTYPLHPDASDWVGALEQALVPPAPAAPAAPPVTGAPTPAAVGAAR